MEREDMRQRSGDIMRAAVRGNHLIETVSAAQAAADIPACVQVDKEQLTQKAREILDEKTKNPFYALLRALGLKVVNRHTALLAVEQAQNDRLNTFLTVDEERLAMAAENLCRALAEAEDTHHRQHTADREQAARLFARVEEQEQTIARLNADLAGQQDMVLKHVQFMLSRLGRENGEDPMAVQLTEMLADMEVTPCWTAEGTPYTDKAMFTELKLKDAEKRHAKPCLLGAEGVLLKGVRFLPADDEN